VMDVSRGHWQKISGPYRQVTGFLTVWPD